MEAWQGRPVSQLESTMGAGHGTLPCHVQITFIGGSSVSTKAEIVEFLKREMPQSRCIVEEVGGASATVRHHVGTDELRPGGTVSGPVLMTVADVALYVALLGEIGIVPLAATTSLTINFLRKPSPDRSIVGVCKLIKVGRSLAVGDVLLYSEGSRELVAHAVGTYSIPQKVGR
jgi:acyl-coenzyme A thioesterase PaaI-like protein